MTALEKLAKMNSTSGTSALDRLANLGMDNGGANAPSPSLNYLKNSLDTAKQEEQSAINAVNDYVSKNMGALDLQDPAILEGLRKTAEDATAKRVKLEQEYNATEGSYEQQFGNLSKFDKAAASVIAKPFLAVDVAAETAKAAAKGEDINMNTLPMQKYGQMTQARQDITEGMGEVGTMLTNTGLSIADNLYSRLLLPGVPYGATVPMFVTAAADKMYDLGSQGESATSALVRGGVSGAIEGLTEALPLGTLADMIKTGGKGVVKNLLKQSGVEATEEGVSYAANFIADKIAKDPNAKWDWKEFRDSVVGGGLSGLFFGLGGTVIGNQNKQPPLTPPTRPVDAQTVVPPTTPLSEQKTAPNAVNGAEAEYRAEKPQNVEYPTVPIINLSMQDVANLNGGKLPDKGNYLRKAAITRARHRLGLDKNKAAYIEASNVRRNGEEYVLKLTSASVNKMLNPADGSDVPNEAIAILENIERIANNGVYFRSGGDEKGRPQIAGFDHLMTTVYIDNVPTVVDMRVKLVEETRDEDIDNVLYYFTPEAITITKDGSAPAAERQAFRGEASPSFNATISQTDPVVNTSDTESVGAGKSIPFASENPTITEEINGEPIRGFSENVATDAAMEENLRKTFSDDPLVYERLANADTLAKAQAIFDGGFDSARSTLEQAIGAAKNGAKLAPEMVPLSRMVANELARNNKVDEARSILSDIAVELTAAGQLGQAANIMRMTDPATVLTTLKKAVENINNDGKKRYGKKWKDVSLTDEEVSAAQNIQTGDDGAFEALYEQVARRIGSEMDSTLWEKITEIRRVAMLLNPKTQLRNVVGNVPLSVMRKASEKISGSIQDARVKSGKLSAEEQTRTGRKISEQSKSIAEQLYSQNKEVLRKTADKWDMNSLIRDYRKYFGDSKAGQAADAVREFTYTLLEMGDLPFLKSAFVDNAARYIEAQGYTDIKNVPQKVVEFATQQAFEATFKDASTVASALNKLKKNGIGGAALDVILPFTTTPINIAKRTIEYSPAGLVKAAYNAYKGKGDAASRIDDLSKGLTGTGVILLGTFLAAMGAITGGDDDNQDKRALDKATGRNAYSIAGRVSYEWAQPIGTQLAIGAEIWDAIESGESVGDAFVNATTAAGDTLMDMTILSNIKDLFSGNGSPTETILETLASGFTSQLPPSLLGSLARYVDPVVRTALYNEGPAAAALSGMASKTPFASTLLPATVNVKGEETRRIENPFLRAAQETTNPATVNIGKRNEVDDEIYRLHESTGSLSVFPKKVGNTIDANNETTKLSTREKQDYQKSLGQTYYKVVGNMLDSETYKNASDADKVKYLAAAEEYATQLAKQSILGKAYELDKKFQLAQKSQKELGIPTEEYLMLSKMYPNNTTTLNGEDIRTAYDNGIDPTDYMEWTVGKKKYDSDKNGSYSTAENIAAIDATGMTGKERTAMFMITFPQWVETAEKRGVDFDDYVDYKVATTGASTKADKLAALRNAGYTVAEANRIYREMEQ